MYDIIVLGGGPAGLSAAINARARNKAVLVVSNPYTENVLARSPHILNYPGFPDISGQELLAKMHEHALAAGAEFIEKRVISIMDMGKSWFLSAEDDVLETRALILAGGIVRGKKFAGEEEKTGRGVSYCATCDGMLYRGKHVAVYGETESAEEEAAYLVGLNCDVDYFSQKASVGHLPVTIPFHRIREFQICGGAAVSHVLADGEKYDCAAVFILRASVAPTDLLPKIEAADGHIRVSSQMETNLRGVYAAGDCIGQPYQIAKAVGEGQIAALTAAAWLDQE